MTNIQHLTQLLQEIAKITDEAISSEQAIEKGLPRYLFIEYNKVYGGYRLVNVNVNNGGHSGAFGNSDIDPRMTYKEMKIMLHGILAGLNCLQSAIDKSK